jgi:alginate O-acetyltransferase complex protein AlgI
MDWIQYIFGSNTDPQQAFFFNRFDFWVFFTVAFLLFTLVYKKARFRNFYLVVFSLFFYWKSGGWYFLLLLFSTIVDYSIGKKIFKTDRKSSRKWLVALSVFINLGVLAYFKYSYFFIDNINELFGTEFMAVNIFPAIANSLSGSHFNIENIFLPIGISFYTFQTISYTVDVYRKKVKPVKNILDFAFYVSFFPQLVAGPIVRASDFVPQIYKKYHLTRDEMGKALLLILTGLIKKILIADYLGANFVADVFSQPEKFTGFQNLTAIYGFAFQIYGDFSGYTDIAIGIALLFGFRLPLNFNSPYKAVNITDFWRRWHISLSSWLRDYLYIPLGGNRHGKLNTYKNLAITMLLGGLWHGAAWRFIFWGGLHGVALAFHKLSNEIFSGVRSGRTWVKIFFAIITFHFVCFCWVFFAANDMHTGWVMLGQIFNHFYFSNMVETVLGYYNIYLVLLFALITHVLPVKWKETYTQAFIRIPDYMKVIVMIITAFLLYQVLSADIQPFIYFQF